MSILNRPFLLSPAGKDYLWGGNRLKTEYGKKLRMTPLAETWECSTHPDGLCKAASGIHKGETLRDVLTKHPEYIGTHPDVKEAGELPILVKFIDADKDLSVQVHPGDTYAARYEHGSRGKTEMWYVLDACPDAELIYGFSHDTDPDTVREAIAQGTLSDHLQHVPVMKNDVFYVAAGTVHAIGAGAIIAEIQENSNITYRLYDYDRKDKDGNLRPLHIDKALEVADLKRAGAPVQPMRVLRYEPGVARELLCRCKYFEVHRMLINEETGKGIRYMSDSLSFRVLLCIDGSGSLTYKDGGEVIEVNITKGSCIFIPADSVKIKLHGKLQLLDICG